MDKSSPRAEALAPSEIIVKREIWKNGAHSVARKHGQFVATRKWHGKEDTRKIKDIVIHIEIFPETYKPRKKRVAKPQIITKFHKTGVRPDKFVYLLQAKFGKEYRNFSMTSSELYRMDEKTKMSLYGQTIHAYNDSPLEGLKLIRIYNSYTMETIRRY